MSTSAVSPSSRKRIIGELTRGREIAGHLRLVLSGGEDHIIHDLPPARGLVGKILDSFNRSISLLGGELAPPPAELGRKPEESGNSCKKDRRGCYKRRRTSETWIKESPTLFEDGHAWRKYGQKAILHAKHPRNYFRCTHKFDEVGCQASKQVQMIRDDPPLYRTTYHGQHICQNMTFNGSEASSFHQIIVENPPEDHSSVMWSFGSDEAANNNLAGNIGDSSAVINQDYFAFDACPGLTAFSSGSGGDVISSTDVLSCTASTRSMEMEMEMEMEMDMNMMVDDYVLDDFLEFHGNF